MTTTTSPPLKTDSPGRIHATREYREALLDAFEKTNLPGTKFAATHGVKYTTFANWCQKRRRERHDRVAPADRTTASNSLAQSLVELDLTAPSEPRHAERPSGETAAPLRLQHASGICLCIDNERHAKLAATLLRELNSSKPC